MGIRKQSKGLAPLLPENSRRRGVMGLAPLLPETSRRRGVTGFTSVEIMIVLSIVALFVSVSIVEGLKFKKRANESNCQANLKSIAAAFEIYAARNGGAYAQQEESNLQFLIDASCLYQDLVSTKPFGNFRYTIGSVGPGGYDVRAMAVGSGLADHNYQITSGGILRRSPTSSPGDTDFQNF